jgi:hypothetical protein
VQAQTTMRHVGAVLLSPCCEAVLLMPGPTHGQHAHEHASTSGGHGGGGNGGGDGHHHSGGGWAFPCRPSEADTSIHHAVAITAVREVAGLHIANNISSHWIEVRGACLWWWKGKRVHDGQPPPLAVRVCVLPALLPPLSGLPPPPPLSPLHHHHLPPLTTATTTTGRSRRRPSQALHRNQRCG